MTQQTTTATTATTTPLGYAESASPAALPSQIRAWPLLVPNVMTLSILFLPLVNGEGPIAPVFRYVAYWFRNHRYPPSGFTWEAMITAPFLLAIPLALWTIRLSLAPRPRRIERIIAWSITLVSLTMTLLCCAYCLVLGPRRFGIPVLASVFVLAISATGLSLLRHLRHAWPVALLAMTAAWALNATLTLLVLLSHTKWVAGMVAIAITVLAQIIVGIICICRWRSVTPAA